MEWDITHTIPYRHIFLLHELHFPVVHFPNVDILILLAMISANPIGKSEAAVVVYSIDGVGKHLVEAREIHAEAVIKIRVLLVGIPGVILGQRERNVCNLTSLFAGFVDRTYVLPSRNKI